MGLLLSSPTTALQSIQSPVTSVGDRLRTLMETVRIKRRWDKNGDGRGKSGDGKALGREEEERKAKSAEKGSLEGRDSRLGRTIRTHIHH